MMRTMGFVPYGQGAAGRSFSFEPCSLKAVDFRQRKIADGGLVMIMSEDPLQRGETLPGQVERFLCSTLPSIAICQADRCDGKGWILCRQFLRGDGTAFLK